MPTTPAPRRLQPRGIRRRLSVAFLLLVCLSAVLAVTAIFNLRQVEVDARRFREENREARIAFLLLTRLDALQQVAAEPGQRATALAATRDANHLLEDLFGASHADPSDPEHQAAEDRIGSTLTEGLERLERYGRGEIELDAGERAAVVGGILAWAKQIERETAQEADRAMSDLDERIDGLVWGSVTTPLLVAAILAAIFLLVDRLVVGPLVALRRGAERLGSGDLDHRIDLTTPDELGDLAREFNLMAERLASMHRTLEGRVRDRTREFIEAARLADLGTFAAGIAHEVNTPLASIASCAEGLERKVKAGTARREEQLDYLGTITREAYRAHDIASRLLAFARKDPGPTSLFHLDAAVRDAARLLQHQIESRGLSLRLDLDAEAAVEANPAEMEQAVVNVLKNAIEASPEGGTVTVSCRAYDDRVSVEIADQGSGIAAADRDRVFDPFFTTKAAGKGTGLGLSLSYRIVETYGGEIRVRDAPGGGALFEITMPRGSSGGLESHTLGAIGVA